ncbi:hypothetical protein PCL1606_41000 [Pseudomonas chlororaphis]|uniref:Uncharacterized protein n=1 Tax=Pseudomonas chlororaphis TaxID=587753 RepID=A0A0D5Y3C1_9PSED|nr:hypothetical protein PCL1606_41000 [Pseudomonas chlororaphis]
MTRREQDIHSGTYLRAGPDHPPRPGPAGNRAGTRLCWKLILLEPN